MRRTSSALTKTIVGAALVASTVSAQQILPSSGARRGDSTPPAADSTVTPGGTTAGADSATAESLSSLAGMAATRGARYLLRNGIDYIKYQEYERALKYLREAESRQKELSEPEKLALKQAIERAQRGLREAVGSQTPYALSQRTQGAGVFAPARPETRIAAARPVRLPSETPQTVIRTASREGDDQGQPIQLAGAEITTTAAATAASAAPAPPETSLMPQPLPIGTGQPAELPIVSKPEAAAGSADATAGKLAGSANASPTTASEPASMAQTPVSPAPAGGAASPDAPADIQVSGLAPLPPITPLAETQPPAHGGVAEPPAAAASNATAPESAGPQPIAPPAGPSSATNPAPAPAEDAGTAPVFAPNVEFQPRAATPPAETRPAPLPMPETPASQPVQAVQGQPVAPQPDAATAAGAGATPAPGPIPAGPTSLGRPVMLDPQPATPSAPASPAPASATDESAGAAPSFAPNIEFQPRALAPPAQAAPVADVSSATAPSTLDAQAITASSPPAVQPAAEPPPAQPAAGSPAVQPAAEPPATPGAAPVETSAAVTATAAPAPAATAPAAINLEPPAGPDQKPASDPVQPSGESELVPLPPLSRQGDVSSPEPGRGDQERPPLPSQPAQAPASGPGSESAANPSASSPADADMLPPLPQTPALPADRQAEPVKDQPDVPQPAAPAPTDSTNNPQTPPGADAAAPPVAIRTDELPALPPGAVGASDPKIQAEPLPPAASELPATPAGSPASAPVGIDASPKPALEADKTVAQPSSGTVLPDQPAMSAPEMAEPRTRRGIPADTSTLLPRRENPSSTLRPELQRQVEELARMQDAETVRPQARPLPDNQPPGGVPAESVTDLRTQTQTQVDISRAPSPAEARPIRAIPVPEDWVPLGPRSWSPQRKYWAAAATCHMPLYFQDPMLERYGHSVEQYFGPLGRYMAYPVDDHTQTTQRLQMAQPWFSAGLFAWQIITWPYALVVDPPWEAQYDLGYWRPGDRIPTDLYYQPLTGTGPPLRGRNY